MDGRLLVNEPDHAGLCDSNHRVPAHELLELLFTQALGSSRLLREHQVAAVRG